MNFDIEFEKWYKEWQQLGFANKKDAAKAAAKHFRLKALEDMQWELDPDTCEARDADAKDTVVYVRNTLKAEISKLKE